MTKIVKEFSPVAALTALVEETVKYLQESHNYYAGTVLVTLSSSIENLIRPCPEPQKEAIWKFFTDYRHELEKHFDFEESEVFPYVDDLLSGRRSEDASIDDLQEKHEGIDETLSDLRNLLKMSFPGHLEGREEVIVFMESLHDDFKRHTYIEDEVMVPLVRMLEKMPPGLVAKRPPVMAPSQQEELSQREKEILAGVAQGMLNKEIAYKYNISVNTVITHRKNITRKTGIKTTAGLTLYAFLNNLLDISSLQ
ncbi:MAG: helix-turn-helix transcriptional regulator [Bacteroidales bacterium]|nr:helix-turn-helix transcriptional regulator [Bacteroidales bacterium]